MPIPQELIAVDQWVLWRYEQRSGGKPTKVPYQPNGQRASSTDPRTWTDYDTARAAADEDGTIAGVGFVVSASDDFVGLDLDHCLDPATGKLKDYAAAIVQRCASYTEISPSGEGLRIICRARNLIPAGRSELVEVYPNKRFLTITGRQLPNTPDECLYADDGILFALRFVSQRQGETQPRATDPVVARIKDAGLYVRQVSEGIHEILCPWHDQHTGGDTSGTKYLEAHYNGYQYSAYHCHHAHCASRSTSEFLRAIGTPASEESTANSWFWVGAEIFANAPVTQWVVSDWMTSGTVSLLYGKKDSYKSFVAISAGMAVAAGIEWHGYPTTPGGFAYLCGEGRSGIAARMQAWAAHHQQDPTRLPLFLGKRRMRLDSEEEVRQIADNLAETIEGLQWPCLRLLAIDTLSSSTPGLDENDAAMMAKAIDVVKVGIAERFGCAVLLVHHAGKDAERGARGSSSIEGNTEAVFVLSRVNGSDPPQVQLECKHIKDADKPETLILQRKIQPVLGGSNLVFERLTDEAIARQRSDERREGFWSQSATEKRVALEMLLAGHSIRDISECLKDSGIEVSKSTVGRWRDAFMEFGDLKNPASH